MKTWPILLALILLPPAYARGDNAPNAQVADPTALGKTIGSSAAATTTINSSFLNSNQKYTGGADTVRVMGQVPARDNMGVSGQKSVETTLRCGRTTYAAGLAIKTYTCLVDPTGKIAAVRVSGCDKGLQGGVCLDADFVNPQQANVGQTAVFGDYLVSVTSCGTDRCAATVTQNQTVSTTGAQLNNHAANAAATAEKNSALGSIQTTYESKDYNKQMAKTGGQFRDCYADMRASVDGKSAVSSCDGSSSATMGALDLDARCEPVRQCVRYATTNSTWTESCTLSVSTIGQTCDVDKAFPVCIIKGPPVTKQCNVSQSATVTATCASGSLNSSKGMCEEVTYPKNGGPPVITYTTPVYSVDSAWGSGCSNLEQNRP